MKPRYIVTAHDLKTDEADWMIGTWEEAIHNAEKWRDKGWHVSIHEAARQVARLTPASSNTRLNNVDFVDP